MDTYWFRLSMIQIIKIQFKIISIKQEILLDFIGKKKNINSTHKIAGPICYSKINYLNYIQLTALASVEYLEGEIGKEQNIIDVFKSSIFSELDSNIEFKNLSFITNNSDIIAILEAVFMIKRNKPFTIISIKGTSNYLDFS